ncbi:MAG TPA: respiratory nitrate reductase subunit gamma [Thermoplasmata archaeon]
MPSGRYLWHRNVLYIGLAAILVAFGIVIMLLPYDTVYVQERAYLQFFLVSIIICVWVFVIGSVYNALIWMHGRGLTGSPEGRLLRTTGKAFRFVFSKRFWKVLSVFLSEAFYLSKLKDRSYTRWLMHILILGGFALMFLLDIIVTISMDLLQYEPMIEESGWAKMWIRDFAFDFAGLMMLLGLCIAAIRRFVQRPKIIRTELPDAVSIIFLLVVVLGGFLLEGIGIAGSIPDHEINHEYSFVGYVFSLPFPASSGDFYDQAWLLHGIASALLIAYIPFSKLFHMIATPIVIEAERLLPAEVSS